jgi:hypothetical protein
MVKMLRLGKSAGPCNLCGATGLVELWDVQGEYEPCNGCRGSGHNANNLIVVERESKTTKFQKKCQILEEAFLAFGLSDYEDYASPECEWANIFCDPADYWRDVTPGIYLARMYLHDDARRKKVEEFVNYAFNNLLEFYNWKQDMGFNELAEITAGGQYWSEAEEA